MTPQQQFEYKMKWQPGIRVAIHSDLRGRGKDWCKHWLQPWHWKHVQWTDVYEDTFHFEKMRFAKGFVENFPEWAKIIEN